VITGTITHNTTTTVFCDGSDNSLVQLSHHLTIERITPFRSIESKSCNSLVFSDANTHRRSFPGRCKHNHSLFIDGFDPGVPLMNDERYSAFLN
jgi:hypothetical protein